MSTVKPPATPAEAEEHAKDAVRAYLEACGMVTREQVGDALMKLASVVGLMMAATEGKAVAVARLQGTTQFVHSKAPTAPLATPMRH